VMRVRYADQVAAFLDRAEAAGVRHVTLLSTYNGDRAPREVDIAAVEADVAGREAFTYSILRPAWVMQNFTDDHLPLVNGALIVPSGGGAEAFVDAADIAAVAAGLPAGYAVMLRWLTGAIIAGIGSTPAGDIPAVLGRPATSFSAFAQRSAAAWTTPESK
jgi:hypothetical protein